MVHIVARTGSGLEDLLLTTDTLDGATITEVARDTKKNYICDYELEIHIQLQSGKMVYLKLRQ